MTTAATIWCWMQQATSAPRRCKPRSSPRSRATDCPRRSSATTPGCGATSPTAPATRPLTVWLLRLGVRVLHGRPYRPQTQGKEERFHRTLKQELLSRHTWRDLAHCAAEFPRYRQRYNHERPHDSLQGDTPAKHYQPSVRSLPDHLAPAGVSRMEVRTVRAKGVITFGNQTWGIGEALRDCPSACAQARRPTGSGTFTSLTLNLARSI